MNRLYLSTPSGILWLLITLGWFSNVWASSPPSYGTVDRLDMKQGLIVIDDRLMRISDNVIVHAKQSHAGDLLHEVRVGKQIGYRAEFTAGEGAVRWLLHEIWILDHPRLQRSRKGPPMELP